MTDVVIAVKSRSTNKFYRFFDGIVFGTFWYVI